MAGLNEILANLWIEARINYANKERKNIKNINYAELAACVWLAALFDLVYFILIEDIQSNELNSGN